jgi:hypothetical protein
MLLEKIASAKLMIAQALLKLEAASDWDKLNDPAMREKLKTQLKDKLRLDSEKKTKGIPLSNRGKGINEVRVEDKFPKQKSTSEMTMEELATHEADKEQKILKRMSDKAKLQRGILELNEEAAKPLLRIMSFIKRVDLDSPVVVKYKHVIDSIFHGDNSKDNFRPSMLRKDKDGKPFFVITSAQLDFVTTIFEDVQARLQKAKAKEEKQKDQFKNLLPKSPSAPKVPKHEVTNFDDLKDEDITLDEHSLKLIGE